MLPQKPCSHAKTPAQWTLIASLFATLNCVIFHSKNNKKAQNVFDCNPHYKVQSVCFVLNRVLESWYPNFLYCLGFQ